MTVENVENKAACQGVTDPEVKFFEGEYISVEEWEERRPKGVTFSFTPEELDVFAEVSRLVAKLSGKVVQPDKVMAGENAHKHALGVHQQGIFTNTDRPVG